MWYHPGRKRFFISEAVLTNVNLHFFFHLCTIVFYFVTTPEDGGFPFGPVNKPTGPRSFLMDCNGPFGLVSFTMGRFFKTLGSSCDTIGQFNKTVFCVRSARWPPRSLPADCTCFCLFWSSVCKNLHNCPSLTHTTHTHSSCINFASYSSTQFVKGLSAEVH